MRARFDCGVCGTPRVPGEKCRPCANRRNREYKLRHAPRVAADRARYKKARWAAGAPERAAKKAAKRASLPARRKAAKRKWKAANPNQARADCAKRHALEMSQLCECCTPGQLKAFYALSGPGTEVDHILPLKAAELLGIKGAHCLSNLQILTNELHAEKTCTHDRALIARLKREKRTRTGPFAPIQTKPNTAAAAAP
jgi:hypothetical protein